ncbi:MAG: TIGR03621 family F420-dependent LLM class oxidoreductase [Candidatus Dormibacteraeota bacterium]|nr:TIGR03621 family F420-dependent LLM class oxidoreductase [Candidatus Dormibacteraeota bacterium]
MTNRREFRFGVMAEGITERPQLLETAREAEACGYDTFLIRDHFIAEPFGNQLGPISALATVAAITTRLRIGTMVICNDYRHPALLAQEAATLDVLSEGRFELGLGAGFSQPEYEAAGIPFERPGVRIGRLEESIACLKALFREGEATYRGRYYQLGLDGFPKPVQRPHPPLVLAGALPRMLRLVAREADVAQLQTVDLTSGRQQDPGGSRLAEQEGARLGLLREAAGDRWPDLELSKIVTVVAAGDPVRAAADLSRQRGWTGVTPEQVLEMPSVVIGTEASIADRLLERRERYGFSYYVVGRASMSTLAPVVARLAGR